MKNISILGSTGSIGTQALDVIRHNRGKFNVVGLSANKNIELLYKQIIEFKPKLAAVFDQDSAVNLSKMLKGTKTEVTCGMDGLIAAAEMDDADTILTSVVGMVGLVPTISAIKKNKEIALANKETLVAGGSIVKEALKKSSAKLVPVDSEHCAIFQCLQSSSSKDEVKRLILTASGGPFRGKKRDELEWVTPQMALKHPNWNMGKKVTIDSATLMNKGLEVIEAHYLFEMDFDKIDVVIHPQSIIHSMVEYRDGSVMAQLGVHDMRNPILYALGYPERLNTALEGLDFTKLDKLTFEKPDYESFRSLKLAYQAGVEGGTMPTVLNCANEVAVDMFLKGVIKFTDIPEIVDRAMMEHENISHPTLEDILHTDKVSRKKVYDRLKVVKQ
mgnify:CR=1 FL=1